MGSLISVIIPAYNAQDTLSLTIASALRQTYSNIEVIVVDDGSDVSPEKIINQFDDNRISLFRIERTNASNANVARNFGISKSKGEYIAMLDADDQWLDHHLEDCLSLLKKTNVDGVYGSLILSREKADIRHIKHDKVVNARELNEGESMIDYLLTTGMGAQTSSIFTTENSAKDILWDAKLIDHQDYDFVLRFHKKYRWVAKKEPTVLYSPNPRRNAHFESCIRFVEKNKAEVEPSVYCRYNLKMMKYATKVEAPHNIVQYFCREVTKYKECISYQFYISIMKPKNFFMEWIEKIKYLYYIMLYSKSQQVSVK